MEDNLDSLSPEIPKISVVVPVFNMERYLAKSLDSVIFQSLREIEIICIDDGSTDSTPQILAEYAARDSRIRVITQENKGVGAARNVGIRVARGEFIAFLDPDDFLPDEGTYAELYSLAKKNNVRVCGGSIYTFNVAKNKICVPGKSGYLADQAFRKDGLLSFSEWQFDYGFYRYIFDREMLVGNEIFFPEYVRFQDPPFCARALETAGTFYAMQCPTYIYRWGHSSPNFTDPRRIVDLLRGIRDQLKFSRERNYAKLHWIQIHHLFEEFNSRVCVALNAFPELVESHGVRALPDSTTPIVKEFFDILKEIDGLVDISLARKYKSDTPYFSVYGNIFESEIKVSVIIPVYNVEKYLRECLASVVNQKLKEIEIICVDDGSKDSSPEILKEYAERDSRVKIISKPNSGYGHTMNVGLAAASGEYIGIVESDDYVVPEMYENLFKTAHKLHLDIIKGDYCRFLGDGQERKFSRSRITGVKNCGIVFNMQETVLPFTFNMVTWAGIYNRKYLVENNIRWNETPGAAFQDNGFWFLSFCYAGKVYFVDKPYYMLRRDNSGSSVFAKDKVFSRDEEFRYIRRRIEQDQELWNRLKETWAHLYCRVDSLEWTFGRIGEEFEKEFVYEKSRITAKLLMEGLLREKDFSDKNWKKIKLLVRKPDAFLKDLANRKQNLSKMSEGAPSRVAFRGDSLLKRLVVRIAAMFILNKSARKRWRARHIDLTPRDGIDIRKTPADTNGSCKGSKINSKRNLQS
ncbi:MAG: glycosyltransferase [Opitutae bacterium]|nr:glycosyltransferase [Opitutae bacterium]